MSRTALFVGGPYDGRLMAVTGQYYDVVSVKPLAPYYLAKVESEPVAQDYERTTYRACVLPGDAIVFAPTTMSLAEVVMELLDGYKSKRGREL